MFFSSECYIDVITINIETSKVKKECYLIKKDNAIYIFSIKLSFSSVGQDKPKLQKQIIKLLILIATAA